MLSEGTERPQDANRWGCSSTTTNVLSCQLSCFDRLQVLVLRWAGTWLGLRMLHLPLLIVAVA